jgi:putative GTP pyrophosphokinase
MKDDAGTRLLAKTISYREREPLLKATSLVIEQEFREILEHTSHIDRISCRAKSLKSFIVKATDPENDPGYQYPLLEIEDQVAARVIVFFLSDIAVVRERLLRNLTPVEYRKRRPAKDEEFGYESEHVVCILPPHMKSNEWVQRDDMPTTFELQIRTLFMHAYAEPQHDMGYKAAGELPSDIRRELAWIAASSWGADQAYERFCGWYQKTLASTS